MPCTYTFELSKESNQDKEQGGYSGQWIRVTCTAATDPDDEAFTTAIFVYQREQVQNITDPAAAKVHSFFSHVACPNDLEEIVPEAEPADADTATPSFRLNYFEAYLRSREELDDLWTVVKQDVAALKRALQRRCSEQEDPETVTI